jgi:hypothetical protein
LTPVLAAISDWSSGPPSGKIRAFFSEWLISLQSSGLCGFGTALEIRVFGDTCEFRGQWGFCNSSRTGKSIRFRDRHIEVRFLPPQPPSPAVSDSLQPAPHRPGNPGFSCVQLVSRLPLSHSSGRNVGKSPVYSRKIPVLRRRLAETSSITPAARPWHLASTQSRGVRSYGGILVSIRCLDELVQLHRTVLSLSDHPIVSRPCRRSSVP